MQPAFYFGNPSLAFYQGRNLLLSDLDFVKYADKCNLDFR